MNKQGKLYLIPVTLGDTDPYKDMSPRIFKELEHISFFIVENERTARRYLISIGLKERLSEFTFFILNKHTKSNEIASFLQPAIQGNDIGLLSEAGNPCIADPGAVVVKTAHKINVTVIPLTGPSSILLALISSGFNGQQFTFNGYLPLENSPKRAKIKMLEKKAHFGETQIFMETPYRNEKLLSSLLETLAPTTLLCIASMITTSEEFISTKTVSQWKKKRPNRKNKPCIFIVGQ